MKYTKYGLLVTIDELRNILKNVECDAEYNNMEHAIYIKGGEYPQIIQYCRYAECNPINHTALVQ